MSDEKAFDDIGDSEVGKPYRGKMVVHIKVEITKIDDKKGRVKRFTSLEDGFIVIEDTCELRYICIVHSIRKVLRGVL